MLPHSLPPRVGLTHAQSYAARAYVPKPVRRDGCSKSRRDQRRESMSAGVPRATLDLTEALQRRTEAGPRQLECDSCAAHPKPLALAPRQSRNTRSPAQVTERNVRPTKNNTPICAPNNSHDHTSG